uniref:Integrase catalytic domain-containing protein n=1 Tax=Strongyloides venezuelensis TaxID=75913 RepID=A0A0K0G5T8_STRVS
MFSPLSTQSLRESTFYSPIHSYTKFMKIKSMLLSTKLKFCETYNITHYTTTAYNHQKDVIVERFNKTKKEDASKDDDNNKREFTPLANEIVVYKKLPAAHMNNS